MTEWLAYTRTHTPQRKPTHHDPKPDENPEENAPIEVKTVAEVRAEPYKLPAGFAWCEVDMGEPAQAKEAYDLLNRNYVEDDDNMFRFDYSPAFLEWALTPPGHRKEFVVGIRVVSKEGSGQGQGKLVGFITGVPVEMRVYDKTVRALVMLMVMVTCWLVDGVNALDGGWTRRRRRRLRRPLRIGLINLYIPHDPHRCRWWRSTSSAC